MLSRGDVVFVGQKAAGASAGQVQNSGPLPLFLAAKNTGCVPLFFQSWVRMATNRKIEKDGPFALRARRGAGRGLALTGGGRMG
jgi:hypothetical protein